MPVEFALRDRLVAGLSETAVGQSVSWIIRPQEAALPGVTLQWINDPRAQNYKALVGKQFGHAQVDVWAATYVSLVAVKNAVIAALLPAARFGGFGFSRGWLESTDSSEEVTPKAAGGGQTTRTIFRARIDYQFHYGPA